MAFDGIYKVIKARKMVEGQGFVFEDAEKILQETTNPDEKRNLERTFNTLVIIDEAANIKQAMEIPANTPAEEIEKAKSQGTVIVDEKYVVMKTNEGKVENGELFYHDQSKFMTGEEWVKISTDVEDELNMVFAIYKRI